MLVFPTLSVQRECGDSGLLRSTTTVFQDCCVRHVSPPRWCRDGSDERCKLTFWGTKFMQEKVRDPDSYYKNLLSSAPEEAQTGACLHTRDRTARLLPLVERLSNASSKSTFCWRSTVSSAVARPSAIAVLVVPRHLLPMLSGDNVVV